MCPQKPSFEELAELLDGEAEDCCWIAEGGVLSGIPLGCAC
jgi:hypothetical protein